MATFNWLHLTDLHQGMTAQSWMLPEVRSELHRDLRDLHHDCGPWDAVLFTGDLTQRGSRAEFDALDNTLAELGEELDKLGSHPVLLAVPGNHDLERPGKTKDPAVRTLVKWRESPDIHEEFWTDAESPYRKVVHKVFAEYTEWSSRAKHGFPRPAELRQGLLPGDFSAVIQKDGERLGVVGLNSAFLQLGNETTAGQLALHTSQLHAVCDGDGPEWASGCDAALLMTHHPPEWLDERSRDDHLFANIAVPGRFAVHLFGHMHDASATSIRNAGMGARRFWQGASLFGLETWGDGTIRRVHGYSAGRIELGPSEGKLRIWPRRAERTQGKVWQLVNDTSFGRLERDQGTKAETIERLRAPAAVRISVRPPGSGPVSKGAIVWEPTAPGGAYHPAWYVKRVREERIALNTLRSRGSPAIVVWGPSLHGKTTFIKHALSRLPSVLPQGKVARIVEVSLATFGEAMRSEHLFLAELADQIANEAGIQEEGRSPSQWTLGRARERLEEMMEKVILPRDGRLFVLVIDKLDVLLPCSFRESILEMFRRWVQDVAEEPWSALRLVVAVSTTPMMFIRGATRSPFFNVAAQIEIGDLNEEQTRQLAGLYRLQWDDAAINALRVQVGGHPFLLRVAMYEAAVHATPLERILDKKTPEGQSLKQRALQILPPLDKLQGPLCQVARDRSAEIDDDAYEALRSVGLIEREGDVYRFRCKLYEEHFTETCKRT